MAVNKITSPVTDNELINKVNEIIADCNHTCLQTVSFIGEIESSSVGTNDLMFYDTTITPPAGFRYDTTNYDYTVIMWPISTKVQFDMRTLHVGFNSNSIYIYGYGNRYRGWGNPTYVALLVESPKSDVSASYKNPLVVFNPDSTPLSGFFSATSGSTLNADGYYETTIGVARPAEAARCTYPVCVALLNDTDISNYANYATYTYTSDGITLTLYTKSSSTASNFYVCSIDCNAQMVDLTNTFGTGSRVATNGMANILKTSAIATSVSSSSTNAEVVGAKLFYDTCGDIETLINAL